MVVGSSCWCLIVRMAIITNNKLLRSFHMWFVASKRVLELRREKQSRFDSALLLSLLVQRKHSRFQLFSFGDKYERRLSVEHFLKPIPDHDCSHFLCLCKESDKESTADFDAVAFLG
jgi:hypothetical protein